MQAGPERMAATTMGAIDDAVPQAARGRKLMLVVDDDRSLCATLADHFAGTMEVLAAPTGAQGRRIAAERQVDIALVDHRLPDGEGAGLCGDLVASNEATKIIFITAYPSFSHVRQAIRAGAHDYLTKPFELEELELAVGRALRMQQLERVEQVSTYHALRDGGGMVLDGLPAGVSGAIQAAACTHAPVLITGETGTGKSTLAKAIHASSDRRTAPFVGVNCAALPESLIEAELFGVDKGAFTGASSSRKGLFELAEGGTLLLDEVGEMPQHVQAKLLGVLDSGEYRRIGGSALRRSDVRIIAATNASLEGVGEKGFRRDLYYRLSVVRIHLPALRDRKQDIPALCRQLLSASGSPAELSVAEMDRLIAYSWPGNVRELRNVIDRALLLRTEPLCPSLHLDSPLVGASLPSSPSQHSADGDVSPLEEIERRHILAVFERFGGNLAKTAAALRVSLSTLKRRIKEYGVDRSSI